MSKAARGGQGKDLNTLFHGSVDNLWKCPLDRRIAPSGSVCGWHPETADSSSGESVGGPRWLLVGHPSIQRLSRDIRHGLGDP